MKRIGFWSITLIAILVVLCCATTALACTVVAVGKEASADGSTMVTHSCDGWYDHRVVVVPGGTHAEGEMVDIYRDPCQDTMVTPEKFGEVPQVAETYTYFNVAYPFMNEKGVLIGEHTWTGIDDVYNPEGMFVIANLEMLGLQRGSTAREVVQIMGDLAEQYGYGDGGEMLAVTDANEIWIFEIVGPGMLWTPESGTPGAHWAARRLADDEVFVGANRSRLGVIDFNDTENFMWSEGITDLPEQMGWWSEGEDFDFSKIFDSDRTGQFGSSRREWRAFDLLAPSLELPVIDGGSQYDFSIKPDEKVTMDDLFTIYNDHLEGTPYDQTVGVAAGPYGNPNRNSIKSEQIPESAQGYGFERKIAIHTCSYVFIGQARGWLPAEIGTKLWYGADDPSTTCYVPIYAGVTEVPEAWSIGDRRAFDQDSAWWAFNFVNNWAQLRWDAMYEEIHAERAKYMDQFMAEEADIDAEAAKLYEESPEKAAAFLTEYTNNAMNTVYEGWWDFAWKLVGKYYDGLCLEEDGSRTTLGMTNPDFVAASGIGETMIADMEAIYGTTTEEEAPAEEAPAEEAPAATEAPAEEAPAEPAATESTGMSSGAVIGIIVLVVIVIAAVVYFSKKKGSESK